MAAALKDLHIRQGQGNLEHGKSSQGSSVGQVNRLSGDSSQESSGQTGHGNLEHGVALRDLQVRQGHWNLELGGSSLGSSG